MGLCDTTFCDLKFKDVINICDGKRLGRIVDMVLDIKTGKVKGIIIPGPRTFNIFRQIEDIYIPWKNILRIGEDVILVEMFFARKKCPDKECSRGMGKDREEFEGEEIAEAEYSASQRMSRKNPDFYDENISPKILKYLYANSDIKKKKIV